MCDLCGEITTISLIHSICEIREIACILQSIYIRTYAVEIRSNTDIVTSSKFYNSVYMGKQICNGDITLFYERRIEYYVDHSAFFYDLSDLAVIQISWMIENIP